MNFTKTHRVLAQVSVSTLALLSVAGGAYGKDSTDLAPIAAHPIPEVCFTDRTGKQLCLSQWRGQVVLLNVWATWCAPCRKEMPQLDRLQNRFGHLGFNVVALSIDRRGAPAVDNYLTRNNLRRLSVFVDPDASVNETLSAQGIPYSLLINRDGNVVEKFRGVIDWESPDRLASIQSVIDQAKHTSKYATPSNKAK